LPMVKIDHGDAKHANMKNIVVGGNKRFDQRKFDEICSKIVETHSKKFIELGLIDEEKNDKDDNGLRK